MQENLIPYDLDYLISLELLLEYKYDLERLQFETKSVKHLTDWVQQKKPPEHFQIPLPEVRRLPRSECPTGIVGLRMEDADLFIDLKSVLTSAEIEKLWQKTDKLWEKTFKEYCGVLDRWPNIPEADQLTHTILYLQFLKLLKEIYPAELPNVHLS